MKTVWFVCTQNAGRSQMAEALFNLHAQADMRAESAGQQPRPEGIWPNVIEVVRELGIDISRNRPKKLRPEMQLHADWAITLACGATCPLVGDRRVSGVQARGWQGVSPDEGRACATSS